MTNKGKRKPGRNATRKAVPVMPDHKPGAAVDLGEEERRLLYQEYCFEQAAKGYSHREIAKMLAEEFKLPTVPVHVTVGNYIRAAVVYRTKNIAEMREEFLAKALPRLEAIIRNFLPAATNNHAESGRPLYALRRRVVFGTPVECIDCDALQEQAKAAEVILKTTEAARRLLGIGLQENGGDGEAVTAAQVSTLIVQTVTQNFTGPGAAQSIGRLELASGDKTIDALEGSPGI